MMAKRFLDVGILHRRTEIQQRNSSLGSATNQFLIEVMRVIDVNPFFDWFEHHGGHIDRHSIGVAEIPSSEGGRGAIALKDIPVRKPNCRKLLVYDSAFESKEGHTLFAVPRSLLLGTQTSSLKTAYGTASWKAAKLDQGWSGIILSLMWEAARGTESKWKPYFDVMPEHFDIPMFWNAEDLVELKGTAVIGKIGKEQVEADYHDKVLPALNARPDLFLPEDIPTRYSLETYHIMGARLLTRSFTLDQESDQDDSTLGNTTVDSAMDVDSSPRNSSTGDVVAPEDDAGSSQHQEHDEDESDEPSSVMVLVPMADMLNARYKANHAKLFYEQDCLKMVTIKPIQAGEQIFNTYGDPPNSELLRRCGHVDYLPLPSQIYGDNKFGNPGDIVELRADCVVESALKVRGRNESQEDMLERINWWLDEGGDDVFVLELDDEEPTSLQTLDIPTAFARLILHDDEWERAKAKGKLPKPKLEETVLRVLNESLQKRLQDYETTLEADEHLLHVELPPRKRDALIVRIGEKRLLHHFLDRVSEQLAEIQESSQVDKQTKSGKRKTEGVDKSRKKQRA